MTSSVISLSATPHEERSDLLGIVGQPFRCAICGVTVDTADVWHGKADPSTWHRPVRLTTITFLASSVPLDGIERLRQRLAK